MSFLSKHPWVGSHWLTFACLLPFLLMLAVHRALNLSDALMVAAPLGEREAYLYNLLMVGVFYASVTAFLAHTFAFAPRDRGWVIFNLVFLAAWWCGLLIQMSKT